MSDFESRLRDVLDERSTQAPAAAGLADGARRRLRRRRTGWGVVAAVAIVAAAVPLGFSQLGPSSDGGGRTADEPTVTNGLPPGVLETGYRAESWHDVTFEVPVDWGYGGVSAYCIGGKSFTEARPVITRPDTIIPMILCSPGSGYGVSIGDGAALDPAYDSGHVWQFQSEGVTEALYPDGAWLGYWYDMDTVIMVVSPDRATTARVVDSVHKIDGVDPNECPVRQEDAEAAINSTSDSFSICRYDEEGTLTASRRFVGEQSHALQNTILTAPIRKGARECRDPGPMPRTILLTGGGYVGTVVTDSPCKGDNGFFMSGVVREATDAVRRAVDLTRLP